ncbi:hypothetical protein TNCV_4076521 [Trichonephila clavipes]|nr:hypothetical protein TNCV_4076521 [Trichonephila clavipes]
MAFGGSLPQINLGVQGVTQGGLHTLIFKNTNLKSIMYETSVATVEDLTSWILIASADVTSTPDLFDPLSFDIGCAMTYADATSNDSYDNHLSLHF